MTYNVVLGGKLGKPLTPNSDSSKKISEVMVGTVAALDLKTNKQRRVSKE